MFRKDTFEMKNQLTAAALISFAALCLLNGPVVAETRYEYVIGTVTDVETLTNSFTRKTPRNERICQIEDVPIYGEKSEQLRARVNDHRRADWLCCGQ